MGKRTPNVCVVYGINGVGKSTITDRVVSGNNKILVVHGSQELSKIFGSVSRAELELIHPLVKLRAMVAHFSKIFEEQNDRFEYVLWDMHLIVPIRTEVAEHFEDVWSDEYSRYISNAFLIVAEPIDVLNWRLNDQILTGRKRDLTLSNIERDLELNSRKFEDLKLSGHIPRSSSVVVNRQNALETIIQNIVDGLKNSISP